ncbi:hypothetical protein QBC47DRAFT_412317 [Echria macrotheca]|uniref:Ribosome biogenesis protein ALB1 n=1 Tax=Echria macrotheca TaxID=438768 RepID=A0AAJ0BET1_9PEZI|nr:hypothetical protein QBC47DRAFT_412317 [Echria macrotheca]
MPSVKNPNTTSKNRLAAQQNKAKKRASKQATPTSAFFTKQDIQRGAKPRGGLLPTSGPRAAVSKKKARKIEQRRKLVERRKRELGLISGVEEEGMDVDAPPADAQKGDGKGKEVEMDIE